LELGRGKLIRTGNERSVRPGPKKLLRGKRTLEPIRGGKMGNIKRIGKSTNFKLFEKKIFWLCEGATGKRGTF